jgi:hypothetical protein
MKVFHHRINESSMLLDIPSTDGVEIDLRSMNGKIILQHEPFLDGEDFVSWLKTWQGQELILNVKEEGLENRILEILESTGVEDYFFLDQSFPFMVRTLSTGNRNVAARVSDLESSETALGLDCNWIWLDCFFGDWKFLIEVVPKLQSRGKRMCLVSPELVRINSTSEMQSLQSILRENDLHIEAVCTKVKSGWENHES